MSITIPRAEIHAIAARYLEHVEQGVACRKDAA